MTTSTTLSHRDRAVLRAVAAGRCALAGPTLLIDGLRCADQFLYGRLNGAGLVDGAGPVDGAGLLAGTGPARLTPTGRAVLDAA